MEKSDCGRTSRASGASSCRISASLPWLPLAITTVRMLAVAVIVGVPVYLERVRDMARRSAAEADAGLTLAVLRRNLCRKYLRDTRLGELEHLPQLLDAEGMTFRGTLHLDQPPGFVHDDVHVRLRFRVLGIIKVEDRLPAIDADRDCRDLSVHRVRLEHPRLQEPIHREPQCNVGSADGRGARTAVRLQHIAIEGNGALPECIQVYGGPQGAPDQALD